MHVPTSTSPTHHRTLHYRTLHGTILTVSQSNCSNCSLVGKSLQSEFSPNELDLYVIDTLSNVLKYLISKRLVYFVKDTSRSWVNALCNVLYCAADVNASGCLQVSTYNCNQHILNMLNINYVFCNLYRREVK